MQGLGLRQHITQMQYAVIGNTDNVTGVSFLNKFAPLR